MPHPRLRRPSPRLRNGRRATLRLRGRGTETEEVILKRLETAKKEIARSGEYEYIVVNGPLEKAVDDLSSIFTAEKLKSFRFRGGY